jgi:ABC-type lipoprotein export system ATPase subunit
LLEALNQRGVTLIIVTHDQTLGARAGRQLMMEDGRLNSDLRCLPAAQKGQPGQQPQSRQTRQTDRAAQAASSAPPGGVVEPGPLP